MDLVAINDLRARHRQTACAAESYRDAAGRIAPLRDFYRALAATYEQAAREMQIMLDTVERIGSHDIAA